MHSQGKAKNIILKVVITLCILAGILTWVPNLVLGRTDFYWLATIPLGIVALISSMALVVEKKYQKTVCVVLSVVLLLSFPILMFTGTAFEAYDMSKDKEEIVIIPPASTKPIRVGQIFDFINEDYPQPYLIYFGNALCSPF